MVVGVVMRRSHVETAPAAGLAALPRHRMRSPAGMKAAAVPYFLRQVEESLAAVAELSLLALRACQLDRRREQHRLERLESRRGGRDGEKRARAVGRPSVQEVVVHLHHDLASGRERDAGAVREAVAAPARRPGGDPVRVVQRVGNPCAVACRKTGAAEAGPAGSRSAGVEAPARRRPDRMGRGRGSRGARSSAVPARSGPRSTNESAAFAGSRRKQR